MIELELKNLSKRFQQGEVVVDVFRNLNLKLESGRTLAVLGPSGSGKSTLLSLLAGLDSPTEGNVTVAGQSINELNEAERTEFRAKNIGIIFQQFHLFSYLSALENVALPLEMQGVANAMARAERALDQVGLKHRADHLPHALSGGESQRVAIARAMVVEPKILLADEPSGSLDAKTGTAVMDLLFDLVKRNKMTLVLVTHNEELARRCDQEFLFGANH